MNAEGYHGGAWVDWIPFEGRFADIITQGISAEGIH